MSQPRAYYNEIDKQVADWLRNLVRAGHVAPGDVDERSIEDVHPDDLRGYTQCHFFAGIGVWSYALRRAGWPDDRPIWTGSCPCQPFSTSGQKRGFADERHPWPAWHHLIRERRPVAVVGEQVASKDGLAWLDLIQDDMEGEDYAVRAFDLCAAGVGAPHIRQRLYFGSYDTRSPVRGLDHGDDTGLEGHPRDGAGAPRWTQPDRPTTKAGSLGGLADRDHAGQPASARAGKSDRRHEERDDAGRSSAAFGYTEPGATNGFWGPADWLLCADPNGPTWRPVEPGTFPLDHRIAARVVRVRAYGNAIVAPLAEEFIRAFEGALRDVATLDRGAAGGTGPKGRGHAVMSVEDLLS